MSSSARILCGKLATTAVKGSVAQRNAIYAVGARSSRDLQTRAHDLSNEQRQFLRQVSKNESVWNDMAYSLSFAAGPDEKDAVSSKILVNAPNELMQKQLANSQNQLRQVDHKKEWDDEPLPHTLEDALRPSNRAIVITETTVPFRIVDVNQAWEGLCGYSFVECQGKTLGSLLQGPKTDRAAVTAVVSTLLRGEEAGAVLTNYTKDGREFRNRLRVGPLMDGDKATHFVGVLQEIHDEKKWKTSMKH